MLSISLYVPKLNIILGSVPASMTAMSALDPIWNDLYTCFAKVLTRLKNPSRFLASIEPELSITMATSTFAPHLPPGTARKIKRSEKTRDRFQTSFKPISNQFHTCVKLAYTGFQLLSHLLQTNLNWFQTSFKPVSNQFQTG